MKKKDFESQKGAISAFVMMAMVFFLIMIMGIYMLSSKRAQTQTESIGMMQEQYYSEGEEIEKYKNSIASGGIIPIYNKEQLWLIGSEKAVEIEGKVYIFSMNASYELKNDIIIHTEELKPIDESKIIKNHYEIYSYNGESLETY